MKIVDGKRPCSACKIEKDISLFVKSSKSKSGYGSRCKECHRIACEKSSEKRVYTPEEKEKLRARSREYLKTYKQDPEKKLMAQRKYAEKNREKKRKKNAEWKRANKDKVCADTVKRQMMQKNACPSWADHEKIGHFYAIARYLNNNCIHGDKYHVDHIVPIRGKNVCGLHVHWNLRVLEARANQRKSNKWQ